MLRDKLKMSSYKFRNSQEAFENALNLGKFTDDSQDDRQYVGGWMYMYSLGNCDYFKNINDREYLTVEYKSISIPR